jgi:hypothetical protein
MSSEGTHGKGGYYVMRGWVDQTCPANNKRTWRWNINGGVGGYSR